MNCGRDAGIDARIPDGGELAPPQVSMINPGDGMTGVLVSTPIQAGFDKPVMNTLQGMSVKYGPGAGEAVDGIVTYDPGLRVATFTPTVSLVGNQLHTVTLSSIITSASGIALVPFSWTFETANDGIAPVVLMTTPANNATGVSVGSTITVVFSEPVNFVNAANVTVSVASVPVSGTFSTTGARTMVFTPDADLPAASLVDVLLSSGIEDYSSNPMTATSFSFRTQ